jgi:hypothetical protein
MDSSEYVTPGNGLNDQIEAIVRGPRRPTNIVMMITSLLAADRFGVIPVDNPTVPNAETVSKRSCIKV